MLPVMGILTAALGANLLQSPADDKSLFRIGFIGCQSQSDRAVY
jgi:hypothetical protein